MTADRELEIRAWRAVFDAYPEQTELMEKMKRRTRPVVNIEKTIEKTATFRPRVQIQRLQIWRVTTNDVSEDISMNDFRLVYTYLKDRDEGITGPLPPLWDEHIHRLYMGKAGLSVKVPFGTVIGYGGDEKRFQLITVETFLSEPKTEAKPAFFQIVQSDTEVTPEKLNPLRKAVEEEIQPRSLIEPMDPGSSILPSFETLFETFETLSIDGTPDLDRLWALGKVTTTGESDTRVPDEHFDPLSETEMKVMFDEDDAFLETINGIGSEVLKEVLRSGFERKTGLLMEMKNRGI
tara:strand:+ start:1594 stop:2472 length:879 start_codon:yes stop_codon:yes gene_type:complete